MKVYYNNIIAPGVVIGFLNTSYTVNESDGLVNIQIGIDGLLRTSVTVNFSISQNQSDRGRSNLYDLVNSNELL